MDEPTTLVFCMVCGECLGAHRPYFAKEHLDKFPSHTMFLPKTIIDPLTLQNLDEYLEKLYHTTSRRRPSIG